MLDFDVVPTSSDITAVFSLSSGALVSPDGAIQIRFNSNGLIDATQGSGFSSMTGIPYAAGVGYHVELDVNTSSQIYSALVTPDGDIAQVLAANYAFGTPATTLNNIGVQSAIGSYQLFGASLTLPVGTEPSPSITPSPNDTTIPPASRIVDIDGTVWTVSNQASYQNGVADGGANITLMIYYDGGIYVNTTQSGWYKWVTGAGWISNSGNPLGVSASGTTIPTASQITDAQGNIWTVGSGVVYENGLAAGFSANVTTLLYYNGAVDQENSSGDWWSWSGTAWVAISGDPRAPAPSPSSSPSPAPTFTGVAGSFSPSLAAPGQTVTITADITAVTAASNANVDLEIRDASAQVISTAPKETFSGVSFAAGQTRSFTWNYVVPSNTPLGMFYLDVAAFNSTWSQTYFWSSGVSTVTFVSTAPVSLNAITLPGVNISGAEFDLYSASAQVNVNYIYPSPAEMDYYASKSMKVIRVPFDISRMQPQNNQPLSTTEIARLDAVVQYAQTKGLMVLLDPHDYGKMTDDSGTVRVIGVDPLMPQSYFADFWSLMATHYLAQPNVIFGLMNEPNVQTPQQWYGAATAAVNAIRATGAKQMITVPGTAWTGAWDWVTSGNAAAWAGFTDPNFVYEVHQYLDSDASGTHVQCVLGAGSSTLVAFTAWARSQGVKGFLGESGWSSDPSCPPEGYAELNYMSNNSDVWYGYTYWAGGPWWGSYMFSIEPEGLGTGFVLDQPQMTILQLNL